MSNVRRILKNTSYLLISRLITLAIAPVASVLTVRYLGANGFGILSFAIAFTSIFAVFIEFGLDPLIVREAARDLSLARKYLQNIIVIRLFLGVAVAAIIVILVNLLAYPQQTVYVTYVIAASATLTGIYGAFSAVFQAYEKMEYQAIISVAAALASLVGIVIVVTFNFGVIGIAWIYVLTSALTLMYYWFVYTRQYSLPKPEIDEDFWKSSLKESWPMAAMAISVMIYFRVDVVILSLIKGNVAVGFYSVAYTLSEIATVIPGMFMFAIFPILSRLHQDSKTSVVDACAQSIRYLLYLGLPMAFFVTLWAKPIVTLLYGNAFSESATALQIIIWSAALMYVTMVLSSAGVAVNLQRLFMKITFLQVFFNVILNLLMIPTYSYIGASFTTVATEAFGLLFGLFFMKRYGYDFGVRNSSGPPILGLFVIAVVSVLLYLQHAPLVLISIIDLVIYCAVIYKLGLKERDKRLIVDLLGLSRWQKQDGADELNEQEIE